MVDCICGHTMEDHIRGAFVQSCDKCECMSFQPKVQIDSVELRQEREQIKAKEKYGEIALLPGGHPDYDILDYTINELVGLIRYGQMIMARNYSPKAYELGDLIRYQGSILADDLIYERNRLLQDQTINLGKPEIIK
jgi:hypothetical protein